MLLYEIKMLYTKLCIFFPEMTGLKKMYIKQILQVYKEQKLKHVHYKMAHDFYAKIIIEIYLKTKHFLWLLVQDAYTFHI